MWFTLLASVVKKDGGGPLWSQFGSPMPDKLLLIEILCINEQPGLDGTRAHFA